MAMPWPAHPVLLDRAALVASVDALRAQLAQPAADDSPARHHDRQYRVLLLLEHLVAAQALTGLTPAASSFVSAQAERFGLSDWLQAGMSAVADGVAAEAPRA